MSAPITKASIRSFIEELSGFAKTAEQTLTKIEENKPGNTHLFSVFSEKMIAIRGTALQLNLPHIADIARLGEEIAEKGVTSSSSRHVRKCVGSLWDSLTTIKYLLEHYEDETGEEQAILIHRLEKTLEAFGGARETVHPDEIEKLLGDR